MIILCAHCQLPLQLSDTTIQAASCPRCGYLVSPAPPPPSPQPPALPQPPSRSPGAPASFLTVSRNSRRAGSKLATKSNSLLDLFDWKFEKYLTPWVVKATWVYCVFSIIIWAILLLIGFVLQQAGEFADALPATKTPISRQSPEYEFRAPDGLQPSAETSRRLGYAFLVVLKVILLITTLLFLLVILLWIRVVLEGIIVIFNIAETLNHLRTDVQNLEAQKINN